MNLNFQLGNLILAHNTTIEKALNHKMCAWYIGLHVHSCRTRWLSPKSSCGGLPSPLFLTRKTIPIANLHSFIDISQMQLTKMEASYSQGDDDYKAPLDFNSDNGNDIDKLLPELDWSFPWLGTISILVRGRGTMEELRYDTQIPEFTTIYLVKNVPIFNTSGHFPSILQLQSQFFDYSEIFQILQWQLLY